MSGSVGLLPVGAGSPLADIFRVVFEQVLRMQGDNSLAHTTVAASALYAPQYPMYALLSVLVTMAVAACVALILAYFRSADNANALHLARSRETDARHVVYPPHGVLPQFHAVQHVQGPHPEVNGIFPARRSDASDWRFPSSFPPSSHRHTGSHVPVSTHVKSGSGAASRTVQAPERPSTGNPPNPQAKNRSRRRRRKKNSNAAARRRPPARSNEGPDSNSQPVQQTMNAAAAPAPSPLPSGQTTHASRRNRSAQAIEMLNEVLPVAQGTSALHLDIFYVQGNNRQRTWHVAVWRDRITSSAPQVQTFRIPDLSPQMRQVYAVICGLEQVPLMSGQQLLLTANNPPAVAYAQDQWRLQGTLENRAFRYLRELLKNSRSRFSAGIRVFFFPKAQWQNVPSLVEAGFTPAHAQETALRYVRPASRDTVIAFTAPLAAPTDARLAATAAASTVHRQQAPEIPELSTTRYEASSSSAALPTADGSPASVDPNALRCRSPPESHAVLASVSGLRNGATASQVTADGNNQSGNVAEPLVATAALENCSGDQSPPESSQAPGSRDEEILSINDPGFFEWANQRRNLAHIVANTTQSTLFIPLIAAAMLFLYNPPGRARSTEIRGRARKQDVAPFVDALHNSTNALACLLADAGVPTDVLVKIISRLSRDFMKRRNRYGRSILPSFAQLTERIQEQHNSSADGALIRPPVIDGPPLWLVPNEQGVSDAQRFALAENREGLKHYLPDHLQEFLLFSGMKPAESFRFGGLMSVSQEMEYSSQLLTAVIAHHRHLQNEENWHRYNAAYKAATRQNADPRATASDDAGPTASDDAGACEGPAEVPGHEDAAIGSGVGNDSVESRGGDPADLQVADNAGDDGVLANSSAPSSLRRRAFSLARSFLEARLPDNAQSDDEAPVIVSDASDASESIYSPSPTSSEQSSPSPSPRPSGRARQATTLRVTRSMTQDRARLSDS